MTPSTTSRRAPISPSPTTMRSPSSTRPPVATLRRYHQPLRPRGASRPHRRRRRLCRRVPRPLRLTNSPRRCGGGRRELTEHCTALCVRQCDGAPRAHQLRRHSPHHPPQGILRPQGPLCRPPCPCRLNAGQRRSPRPCMLCRQRRLTQPCTLCRHPLCRLGASHQAPSPQRDLHPTNP